jgi:Na+-translocating ferredoxin:NAD+ oxidoreductase subunit B
VTAEPVSSADPLADRIDAELPQTQCTQCGYDGCRPYAEAIARGEAGINRCPPGGDEGVAALARLLDRPVVPIAPECGEAVEKPQVARIDEDLCIGCVKCIQACPVDAIIGAARQMHTVLTAECTGCGLCIPPCPVDCIDLVDNPDPTPLRERAEQFRARYDAHNERIARRRQEREARRRAKRRQLEATRSGTADPRRAEISAAVERARARRQKQNPNRS